MSLPKSADDPASTEPPTSASRASSFGSARAAFTSALSFATISAGVFLGTPMPNYWLASSPGTNSPNVGDARRRLRAIAVVTATRKLCPPWCRVTRGRKSNQQKQCPDLLTSGWQDDGLAGRLRVEEPVGLLGLLEPPAVRDEPLHVHLPIGDELGAGRQAPADARFRANTFDELQHIGGNALASR